MMYDPIYVEMFDNMTVADADMADMARPVEDVHSSRRS